MPPTEPRTPPRPPTAARVNRSFSETPGQDTAAADRFAAALRTVAKSLTATAHALVELADDPAPLDLSATGIAAAVAHQLSADALAVAHAAADAARAVR